MPEPKASDAAADSVVVDVHAASVSLPELLQTAGCTRSSRRCRSAPASSPLRPGDRVAVLCGLGGFADVNVALEHMVAPLPDRLDFDQGAALILNYHTA